MKHEYSSTQVNFSPEATKEFLSSQKSLINKNDLYKPNSGMGLEINPHVTILFGIHAKHPSIDLMNIIETYPKITVTLGDISIFKGIEKDDPFDVVKVDVRCPDLHVLNYILMDSCENTQDFPEYIPHATVAFVKPDTCDYLEGLNRFSGICFLADCVIFSDQLGTHRRLFFGHK